MGRLDMYEIRLDYDTVVKLVDSVLRCLDESCDRCDNRTLCELLNDMSDWQDDHDDK